MADSTMMAQMERKGGFIAALDQSGGSTPGALAQYGLPEPAYREEAQMFRAMHQMRLRIMTTPAFRGDRIIGAILFEGTMDAAIDGLPVPAYLWQRLGIVPFVKVDRGRAAEKDGVEGLKPMPDLDALLERAAKLGVFGTKMRSAILRASEPGIAAAVGQQFDVAERIARYGLVPTVETEVLIKAPDKAEAEDILHGEIAARLDALPADRRVMLKLTLPERAGLYDDFARHPRVVRVVALSGGYPIDEACERLSRNRGMIASFSRALIDDLRYTMDDAAFDATLAGAVDRIYRASTVKA